MSHEIAESLFSLLNAPEMLFQSIISIFYI